MRHRWTRIAFACMLLCGMLPALGCHGAQDPGAQGQGTAAASASAGKDAKSSDSGQEDKTGNFFSFADDETIARFSEGFAKSKPVAVEFSHTTDEGTARTRFRDTSTIETAYKALKRVEVGEATTKRVKGDTAKISFVDKDGYGITFEFEGEYYRYGDMNYKMSGDAYLQMLIDDFSAAAR